MNIWLMIKNTFRNKRFVFFTLITPILYYAMLVMMAKSGGWYENKYSFIWLIVSIIIGVTGNSLVSFAKSVNVMLKFYELQIQTSNYTVLKWLRDELIVQLILNSIISIAVSICAIIIGNVPISTALFESLLLIIIFSIYLSIFGFAIALILDAKALDASSFMMMLGIMFLLIPFSLFAPDNSYLKWITVVQKLFPGYYVNEISERLFLGGQIGNLFIGFVVTTIVTVLVPIIFISYKLKND
ncbi:hypothetical protein ACQW5G_07800 [Fructilactobacillus sp. Tb1]|uniref:hypothetical protein n=1 Tax=Fructilactobacillus sp. Tb1 TaxID=3422304 RepID=UPI003D2D73CC